jgi:hypothetical protein
MSPDPVTVNAPPAWWNPPGSPPFRPAPMLLPCHPPWAALTWSNTPVATLGALFSADTAAGEVTNRPACTVAGSPARLAVPTLIHWRPSAESYPVSVSPDRTRRSHRGKAADTVPGRPGVSSV